MNLETKDNFPSASRRPRAGGALAVVLVLVTVAAAYWPGVAGPFLLDDFSTLSTLGADGGIRSFSEWWHFVLSGNAGPLGRPISLASFTVNALDWPSDPWTFKVTNLLIHLVNTSLVFLLSRDIFCLLKLRHEVWAAALCAAIWGLHPIQVSTVLYVVQRMTQLSALFAFAGLWGYLHGRVLVASDTVKGYGWMIGGIVGGTGLGVLCKENAALIPLFALVLEHTVVAHAKLRPPPGWSHASAILIRIPILLLVAYIAVTSPSWLVGYEHRPFSPLQRLLSQGPFLLDYVEKIVFPRLSGSGLFQDGERLEFDTSRAGLAWLVIGIAILISFSARHRLPLAAAGVGWFFAGHLLESTILPLEPYFEHRNYLPLFGVALAVSAVVGHSNSRALRAAITLTVPLLAGLTYAQSKVWGNSLTAAMVWPMESPSSLRAHQFAANTWQLEGDLATAQRIIADYVDRYPGNAAARVQLLKLQCLSGRVRETDARASITALRHGPFERAIPDTLNTLTQLMEEGACRGLSLPTLVNMIDAARDNRGACNQPQQLAYLAYIEAKAYAGAGHFRSAIERIEEARRHSTSLNVAYWQAIWSLDLGDMAAARRYAKDARAHADSGSPAGGTDPFLEALERRFKNSGTR